MKKRSSKYAVLCLVLGLCVVALLQANSAGSGKIFAQDAPSATHIVVTLDPSLLPHAVTLTLAPTILLTALPTTTLVATINDPALLPKAITATPMDCSNGEKSALSDADREQLDQSVTSTFASDSLQFAVNGQLKVSSGSESASVSIRGTGSGANLDDLKDFQYQVNATVTITLDGATRTISMEQRIVDGVLYTRGEEAATGRKTRWIGISLSDVFSEMFGSLGATLLSGADLPSISKSISVKPDDLLQLFKLGAFVVTTRVDNSSLAQFHTVLLLNCLLRSPKALGMLLELVAKFKGVELPSVMAPTIARVVQSTITKLIPDIQFSIDTTTDSNIQKVTQVVLAASSNLDLGRLTGGPSQFVDVTLNTTLALSNYGAQVSIDAPDDAVMVTSLDNLSPSTMMLPSDAAPTPDQPAEGTTAAD